MGFKASRPTQRLELGHFTLIKAYVVIITLCGDNHGGSYHKSKSPQILVAVLTTGLNHHRYLWRFGSRVGQRSVRAMRVPRVVRTCLTNMYIVSRVFLQVIQECFQATKRERMIQDM